LANPAGLPKRLSFSKKGNQHISAVDADGVALAAIQGLYRLVQAQDAQLRAQQQHIAALEARVAALEQ
jgi:hypothetical protein